MGNDTLIIHAVFWFFGFWFLWKITSCKNEIDKNNITQKSIKPISIIIPARNEERNLPNLFNSINKQSFKVKDIILVDDDSTDSTTLIGRKFKIKVLSLKKLPEGWIGKTWACYNGAKIAKGDYLIFLDADTILHNKAIEEIVSCLNSRRGVISIQPYHKIKKLYENLSLFFNIILIAGMGVFTPLQTRVKPIGAFGPCLICSREDYFKIEGHKSIKGKVMEDIEIGKKFLKEKIPLFCMVGKGTIDFRMYPGGPGEVVKGWSKSFSTGAKSTSIPILLMIIAWIVGAIFPFDLLVRGLLSLDISILIYSALYYIAFALQIYWMSYRIGNFNVLASIFYPITLIFFIIIFFYSLILTIFRKKVYWKDRHIKT